MQYIVGWQTVHVCKTSIVILDSNRFVVGRALSHARLELFLVTFGRRARRYLACRVTRRQSSNVSLQTGSAKKHTRTISQYRNRMQRRAWHNARYSRRARTRTRRTLTGSIGVACRLQRVRALLPSPPPPPPRRRRPPVRRRASACAQCKRSLTLAD
jgi:hypothetical protein